MIYENDTFLRTMMIKGMMELWIGRREDENDDNGIENCMTLDNMTLFDN